MGRNVKNKEKKMKFEIFKLNTLETRLPSWLTLKSAKKFWKACQLKKLPRWTQMKLWLSKLKTDKEKYLESLLKERKNIFEKKIAEFDQKVAEERKTRLERRKEERIEERRRKWMREKEEEEQRRRDELAIKEREEREAREAIEKQREKEEYEKKKAELEE